MVSRFLILLSLLVATSLPLISPFWIAAVTASK